MNAVASYREFLLLAPQPGWGKASTIDHLTPDSNGVYRLDPLPGGAALVPTLAALSAHDPIALAQPGAGALHVLCAQDSRIRVAPLGCETQLRALPGLGGRGHDIRCFRRAQDLALTGSGNIVVADSGNATVKVFSASPYALLAVWSGLGRPVRVAAGSGETLWVIDADQHRVLHVDGDGIVQAVLPGVAMPAAIAVVGGTSVAVLDGSEIRVFGAPYAAGVTIGKVPNASALCAGPDGFLYVGTTTGLVHSFAPTGTDGAWRDAGVGVLGQQAAIARMIWPGGTTLLALVRLPGAAAAAIWSVDTTAARATKGLFASGQLDSGFSKCAWHRIALDADIPDGSSIVVETDTYEPPATAALPDLKPKPIVLSGAARDCLVQGEPGRYLRLTLRLLGNGTATPTLRGIRIWFPREGWLQYLPPLYQEDAESAAFLGRFLAIMQTAFDDFDQTIDDIWTLFDARSVPSKWFGWLAAWLALPIEPRWTDAQRRAVLRDAYKNYRRRGTAAGIEQLVRDYTGVSARLVEHFRLRQLIQLANDPQRTTPMGTGRLWSRDAYRQLQLGVYSQVGMFKLAGEPEPAVEPLSWGAHQFSVFFDANPATVAHTRKRVAAVIEREKPAHTQATYRPVFARMRVGVQATLGVDTRVGETGEAVIGSTSTLGYDSILACAPASCGTAAQRAALRPRVGIDTRLS